MLERVLFLGSRPEPTPILLDSVGPTSIGSSLLRFLQLQRRYITISREDLAPAMRRKLIKVVSSFWLVVLFLAVGWGPLRVADLIREARPDLDASYALQHFAMQWMGTAAVCSLLAIAAAVVWVIRFILRRFAAVES